MSYIEYVTADHECENPLEDLARANRFTMADLEANRNGKISDTQWFRLLLRAVEPVRYSGGALLGWLLACFVVKTFVPTFVLWIISLLGAKGIGVLFGVVTLACVGAFLMDALKSTRTMTLLIADLKAGKAACIEGRVSPSKEDERGLGVARLYGEKHTNYWYVAKNEYFPVDQEAHAALPSGMLFRLYHTPQSKLLLSIEPK
ncbi:MAG: hypothetical protein LAP38_20920 [Acidobacteriia bacterium]|nr:hypothetical protein [Terriglobia bacterium]